MSATSEILLDVDAFEAERPFLFGVAYRMLGSATSAEDIVQEAFLRARGTDTAELRSLRSYLVTVVTRLCLDELKSARAQRERYVGPWLPEPIGAADVAACTPEATVAARESISFAFLVLLESLAPLERAVFLLREVFDYGYEEVAAIVGRTEAGCRQLFRRARQHIEERRPRYSASPEARQRITQRFLAAVGSGDMEGLVSLLASDITLWSDGGGKVAAAINPIYGADRVARFAFGVAEKQAELLARGSTSFEEVNGELAVVFRGPRGRIWNVMFVELDGEVVREVRVVRNPDKLARLSRRSSAAV